MDDFAQSSALKVKVLPVWHV